jgi:peptidase M28-like protein/PDZ domain-containing protein
VRPERSLGLATALALALGLAAALASGAPKAAAPKSRAAPARPAGAPVTAPQADDITARLLAIVRTLADPKWEGRGVGTAGLDSAARYVATEMAARGLTPAGDDGTFFQRMEVTTGVEVGEPCAIEVRGRRYEVGDRFMPIGFSTNGTLKAAVVFAGYGITAPGYDYDDYAGIDAHDKIVLVLTQEPGEMDSTSRFDGSVNTPHAEVRTKAINAREHGALGMLLVNGPRYHAGEPLRKPRTEGGGYMTSGLIAAQIGEDVAAAMLAPAGLDLAGAQKLIDSMGRPHSLGLPDSATVTVTLKRQRTGIENVVGLFVGRDTTRTLVIGAHYDHLGYGGESSLAPDQNVPHVGADDNASGVAVMLGIAGGVRARIATGWRPAHTLVFCAFTAEETGLVGSAHFVDDPARPLPTIEAMLNMDMVGRLRDDRLMVMGVGTAAEFPALVDSVNAATARFQIRTSSDGYGPSDHSSFYKRQIPVLMLFTGAHADYHKPSDTADKINGAGLTRITAFARALIDSLDARPRVRYQRAAADSSVGRIAGGGGYGAYLGTIPDYMQTEGGVLLSGVRAGGPAEKAGLEEGDVIVKFDGVRIDNIYDYTFALRSRKPGQTVRITVKRGGAETDLVATLGRRP